MWDQISDLHACHREVSVDIQLLKLTEETAQSSRGGSAGGAHCPVLSRSMGWPVT